MIINDKDLGEIRLVKKSQAKRIIVRRKDDHFVLSHPPSVSLSYIEKTIEEMKPRLLKLKENRKEIYKFTLDTEFRTFSFELKLVESQSTDNFYLKLKDGILSISYPAETNFDEKKVQDILKGLVEKTLRYEANRLFPKKIEMFAAKFGFTYKGVKINKSRSRWGSCSSKKSINLSYYCMMLPEYLIDFIILHELCHTIEMNHSERFWKLLDKVTANRAKELTKELKAYKTLW